MIYKPINCNYLYHQESQVIIKLNEGTKHFKDNTKEILIEKKIMINHLQDKVKLFFPDNSNKSPERIVSANPIQIIAEQ